MNTILTASCILGLSSVISGRTIANVGQREANNYNRYALNYNAAGDNKGVAWEEGLDDKINGAYPLLGPDGNMGIVEYSADDINGFSALVKTIAASLNSPQPYIKPLFIPLPDVSLPFLNPASYGFGAANLGIGIPSVKVSGSSLPWDPKTGSFGGWIPIRRPTTQRIAKATIMSKKYVNGHLRKVVYRPIPLPHKSVILIKKKKINYD